jgi:hypothetical protein
MKPWASAASAAARTSASVASGLPHRMFSATVPSKTSVSCSTVLMLRPQVG